LRILAKCFLSASRFSADPLLRESVLGGVGVHLDPMGDMDPSQRDLINQHARATPSGRGPVGGPDGVMTGNM